MYIKAGKHCATIEYTRGKTPSSGSIVKALPNPLFSADKSFHMLPLDGAGMAISSVYILLSKCSNGQLSVRVLKPFIGD